MATNPVNGKVYVSNTEARNEVRFEGPGLAFGSTTVQGHLHEARITVLDGANVLPRHLNKHIDYDAASGARRREGAQPRHAARHGGDRRRRDALRRRVRLEHARRLQHRRARERHLRPRAPATTSPLSGGGPTGLVLDEARDRAYVFTRFDNGISVVDSRRATEVAHLPVHTPSRRRS